MRISRTNRLSVVLNTAHRFLSQPASLRLHHVWREARYHEFTRRMELGLKQFLKPTCAALRSRFPNETRYDHRLGKDLITWTGQLFGSDDMFVEMGRRLAERWGMEGSSIPAISKILEDRFRPTVLHSLWYYARQGNPVAQPVGWPKDYRSGKMLPMVLEHPSDFDIQRFVYKSDTVAEAELVEAHLERCADCSAMERIKRNAKEVAPLRIAGDAAFERIEGYKDMAEVIFAKMGFSPQEVHSVFIEERREKFDELARAIDPRSSLAVRMEHTLETELADYANGNLKGGAKLEIESHLRRCEDCKKVYLENYRPPLG